MTLRQKMLAAKLAESLSKMLRAQELGQVEKAWIERARLATARQDLLDDFQKERKAGR